MNFRLNQGQKRLFVIWLCFHSFALFVNLASIDWSITDSKGTAYHIFTSDYNQSKFWPFTRYIVKGAWLKKNSRVVYLSGNPYNTPEGGYYGFFNGYGIPEFITYMILLFGFFYLPRLWWESN